MKASSMMPGVSVRNGTTVRTLVQGIAEAEARRWRSVNAVLLSTLVYGPRPSRSQFRVIGDFLTNLTAELTGLLKARQYYWTFEARNAATNLWAQPSLSFTTTGLPDGTLLMFR